MRLGYATAILLGALTAPACELFVDASRLDVETPGDAAPDAGSDGGAEADTSTGGDGPASDALPDGAADGLVGYWSFDEGRDKTAHDTSGYGNDGTLQPGTTWVAGKVGAGALNFDGTSGAVVVPESPSLDGVGAAMTLALWIDVDEPASGVMWLVSKENAWDVKLNGQSPQLTTTTGHAEFNAPVPANEWHHVALVFQGGMALLYVDGASRSGFSNTLASGQPLLAGTTFRIGAFETSTQYLAKGRLDEVRLYDRALSQVEVAKLAAP
jgi:hypothetical protein